MVEGTQGSRLHKEGRGRLSKRSTDYAGIDTGKHQLDAALHKGGEELQVKNSPEGHSTLSAWLRKHGIKRVGIEASGGYEMDVVAHLRREGFAVIVFQPAQVRAYAKFHLQLAKNDKIDARLIAACTAAKANIHAPPDPRLAPLAAHLTWIDQIGEVAGSLRQKAGHLRQHGGGTGDAVAAPGCALNRRSTGRCPPLPSSISFFVRPKARPFLRPDLPPAGRRAQPPSRMAGAPTYPRDQHCQATLDGGEHGVMLVAGWDVPTRFNGCFGGMLGNRTGI